MPTLFHVRDYRGATVEDLDIKPAISINPSTSLAEATDIAFENEFTNLPVINETNKKLLGILNIESLKNIPKNTPVAPVVKHYMLWFHQNARKKYEDQFSKNSSTTVERTKLNTTIKTPTRSRKYTIVTPLTPLEELSAFFNQGNFFAIITNDEGTFVYGVATPEDLMKYENSRPKL
ncbi:hypothetical protein CLIB1423_03S07118 [[Candida] railenensis]|uniref:CBS domain-containing protein n=1 Tax=[Candida] railenensis TaxID=45579 RepID=A0A9P0QN39_9ASCO|nr:hypothetical protein CLIB1423_03S07118 [[Candida] railenensis]